MIYADHNATTPPLPEVVFAMTRIQSEVWANAGSVHGPGQRARAEVEAAREALARALGAPDPQGVVFTSSGSEAAVTAILGAVPDPAGRHVVTSAVEHPCVRLAFDVLAARGASVTIVPVDRQGRLDAEDVARAIVPGKTALVSVQWANHETGNIHPIPAIARACASRSTVLHVDAVQAFGKIDVDAGAVDLLTVSAHKIHGPKGAGALHVRRGLALSALLPGGQERGRRGGTQDVAAIAGFGVAARALAAGPAARRAVLARLGQRLHEGLCDLGALLNGDPGGRVPGTVGVSFPGVPAELLVIALDLDGIAISAGAACTSGRPGLSPVISAMFPDDPARVASAVRFSLGKDNTDEDIDRILEVVPQALARLRGSLERSGATRT